MEGRLEGRGRLKDLNQKKEKKEKKEKREKRDPSLSGRLPSSDTSRAVAVRPQRALGRRPS
ncbi:hypothetical protein EYF80_041360 [Liparis tanakae]|uniref:Uncharacterized protein n=1 Tax=Liparis tanakae TaxID=230148 RepID=A0A4Z2G6M9_9TELE|nr:hypothetical protein EYF80_041360 [Liparis tanakae]